MAEREKENGLTKLLPIAAFGAVALWAWRSAKAAPTPVPVPTQPVPLETVPPPREDIFPELPPDYPSPPGEEPSPGQPKWPTPELPSVPTPGPIPTPEPVPDIPVDIPEVPTPIPTPVPEPTPIPTPVPEPTPIPEPAPEWPAPEWPGGPSPEVPDVPWEEGYPEQEFPTETVPEAPTVPGASPGVIQQTLPNILELLPRITAYPTSEVEMKADSSWAYVSPGAKVACTWIRKPGYRIVSVGRITVASDFYSRNIVVYATSDNEKSSGNIALTDRTEFVVPDNSFESGTAFQVWIENNTSQVAIVTVQITIVQVTQGFYEQVWAPLVELLFNSLSLGSTI